MRVLLFSIVFTFFSLPMFESCRHSVHGSDKTDLPETDIGKYYLLKGNLNNQPITLHLCKRLKRDYDDVDREFYYGYYYYEKYQNPIFIEGSADSTGFLILKEFLEPESDSQFEGKFDDLSEFKGDWHSGEDSFPFKVAPASPPGSIGLQNHSIVAASPIKPGKEMGPKATVSLAVIWPQGIADAALDAFVQSSIVKGVLGDSILAQPKTPAALIQQQQDDFFRMHKESIQEMGGDTLDIDDDNSYAYNYSLDADVGVLWNEANLLSVGYFSYVYTGGAHGNYSTALVSYDLVQKKALVLRDVFNPGFEKLLNLALEKALRKRFNLSAKAPLTDVLFEDKITYTENFCLTGKGIIFDYVPYEIAPYAVGEIALFVPFTALKAVLKDQYK